MTEQHDAAWKDFWADQGGTARRTTGCLPERWHGIEEVQRGVWQGFAASLPRGAALLDLATGNGKVMGWCLAKRRDLKPVGVDLAPHVPQPPRGAKVRPGTAMEKLPFPDGKFAAVVSQFGFEYGDVAQVAREIARVLTPDGVVALMTHRIDGPILAYNRQRREQIRWVLEEKDLPAIAKRGLALRGMGLGPVPPPVAEAPAEGARLYGSDSAAWEIAEAIRRCLAMGARDHPANVAGLIDTIVAKARNEVGRIDSLEQACQTTDDADGLESALLGAGLKEISVTAVDEARSDRAFADFRIIRRN